MTLIYKENREVTPYLRNASVSGTFATDNGEQVKFKVVITLPDCHDEWILSNIKNRYILNYLKDEGNSKKNNNEKYKEAAYIKTIKIDEESPENKLTNKKPSFYGKSIFDFTYQECQDFAASFGLHAVEVNKSLDYLRKQCFIEYLDKRYDINDRQNKTSTNYNKSKDIKTYSFYKYDKIKNTYYIEIENKDDYIIGEYFCADKAKLDATPIVAGQNTLKFNQTEETEEQLILFSENTPTQQTTAKKKMGEI
jgi:hypothetical protein